MSRRRRNPNREKPSAKVYPYLHRESGRDVWALEDQHGRIVWKGGPESTHDDALEAAILLGQKASTRRKKNPVRRRNPWIARYLSRSGQPYEEFFTTLGQAQRFIKKQLEDKALARFSGTPWSYRRVGGVALRKRAYGRPTKVYRLGGVTIPRTHRGAGFRPFAKAWRPRKNPLTSVEARYLRAVAGLRARRGRRHLREGNAGFARADLAYAAGVARAVADFGPRKMRHRSVRAEERLSARAYRRNPLLQVVRPNRGGRRKHGTRVAGAKRSSRALRRAYRSACRQFKASRTIGDRSAWVVAETRHRGARLTASWKRKNPLTRAEAARVLREAHGNQRLARFSKKYDPDTYADARGRAAGMIRAVKIVGVRGRKKSNPPIRGYANRGGARVHGGQRIKVLGFASLAQARTYPGFAAALALHRRFHGRAPTHLTRVRLEDGSKHVTRRALVLVGEAPAIEYRTWRHANSSKSHTRDGRRIVWRHKLGEQGGKPAYWVHDPVSGVTSLLGGTYRIAGQPAFYHH